MLLSSIYQLIFYHRDSLIAFVFIFSIMNECFAEDLSSNHQKDDYIKEHESCEKLVGTIATDLNCLFNFDISVSHSLSDDETIARASVQPSVRFDFRRFGFTVAYFHYFDEEEKQSYQPDFTYRLGYEDYDPNTISLSYANYGGNRLNPRKGERITRLENGTISLTYRFQFDDKVTTKLSNLKSYFSCNTSANWTPRYYDEVENDDNAANQITLSLGCQYIIWDGIFVRGDALFYPIDDQRQSFNPDYTYGFGYNTYKRNRLAIEYQNYAGNHWPWRQGKNAGGFRDGSVSLIYHLPF